VVERARREDLKKKIRYEVSYIRNKKQKVIIDRRFNLASLMNVYMGRNVVEQQDIAWNPDDPNRMAVQLPGESSHLLSSRSLGVESFLEVVTWISVGFLGSRGPQRSLVVLRPSAAAWEIVLAVQFWGCCEMYHLAKTGSLRGG